MAEAGEDVEEGGGGGGLVVLLLHCRDDVALMREDLGVGEVGLERGFEGSAPVVECPVEGVWEAVLLDVVFDV